MKKQPKKQKHATWSQDQKVSLILIKTKRNKMFAAKLPSVFSHQDRRYSTISRFFVFNFLCPLFNVFLSYELSQLTHMIAGENEFKMLTIPHLKT